MKSAFKSISSPFSSDHIERILSRYYQRLVEWSRILARGDHAVAEEIVQDLCLHLTIAAPDMSRINDLDNYLFICLRNMYVSNLARVSRERLRVIQIEDYDDLGVAAIARGADSLDVQNELLRICDYMISRKYSSKSASYFILHFFMGYRRSEVARLARLPIAGIYNKLKDVRGDLRNYLSSGEKIRVLQRKTPRRKKLLRAALATECFLKELRSDIFDAHPEDCIIDKKLIEAYMQPDAAPVGCQELAHLAGCERCLKLLERALQLDDKDGPLDGIDIDHIPQKDDRKSFDTTMRLTKQLREQLFERRPALLAIAADGRVVAFHAVESMRNSLSSRVEASSSVRFVEIFNEYGDRLAHVSLDVETASFPKDELSQLVSFSDDRWLRLNIRFDGLGLQAEVNYVDPALAPGYELDSLPHALSVPGSFWRRFWRPSSFRLNLWSIATFASLLLAVLGVLSYRYVHPSWRGVLAHAEAADLTPLSMEPLHQTLQIEQVGGLGEGSVLGSVDVWRSSDRKVVRRLYNAQQRLLATSIGSGDGPSSVRVEKGATSAQTARQIIESGVWLSDVSGTAIDTRQTSEAEVFRNWNGFEVTQREDGPDGILTRTLVLDNNYRVQAERVRYRTSVGVFEVRLVQTLLQRVPNREVPFSTFPQPHEMTNPGIQNERNLLPGKGSNTIDDLRAANLEVALLFELFQQKVDIGQPIDIHPIAGGRVRVTGTLVDAHLLEAIRERVATLQNADRVDFQIYSGTEAASVARRGKVSSQQLVGTNGDAPAAGMIRDALLAHGLKGAMLHTAEQEFEASALSHAQAALQHAYALDRLGTLLQRNSHSSLDAGARSKWTKMVEAHSVAAQTELQALSFQLDSISVDSMKIQSISTHEITDAAAFARATSELRSKAQLVNEEVVELFAGSAEDLSTSQARDSIAQLRAALPSTEASSTHAFANRMASYGASAQIEPGQTHTR